MTTPTRPLTVAEAAYLAGFLDGEGSFYMCAEKRPAHLSGYRFSCGLSAAQVELDVLQHIQKYAGGKITYQDRKKPNHKPIYVLYWSAKHILELVPQIQPFLVRKRDVSEWIYRFARHKAKKGSNNYSLADVEEELLCYNAVKKLNMRGTGTYQPLVIDGLREHKSRPATACKIEGCDERTFAKGLCRKHHREKYLNKNEAGPKNCAHCGILMEEARPDQKYCGHSCQMKAYRRRKKAASSPDNLPQDQSND